MAFYVFRLAEIHVISTRDLRQDDDIVTFAVLVNEVTRGRASALFTAMVAGASLAPSVLPPRNGKNINRQWDVGPFQIAAGDAVKVIYSSTNIHDNANITLETEQQDKIELKILDEIVTVAAGAVGGPIGAVLGAALGAITDPVGTLLGFERPVRCNGLVFSEVKLFTGEGLDRLSMAPLSPTVNHPAPPKWPAAAFTDVLTDAATHDTTTCGDVASTEVTLHVFRLPFVSVRRLFTERNNLSPSNGLRQANPQGEVSLKARLGIV
jgi:hypothetical protein